MTFAHFRQKIFKGWFLFVLLVAGSNFLAKPFLTSTTHTASIGVGINVDNSQFNNPNGNLNQLVAYPTLLEQFSAYLTSRFSSVEIQSMIATGFGDRGNFTIETPFYDVTNQSGGFVSLSYETSDRTKAELFNKLSVEAYNKIVTEWNSTSPDIYQIVPMTVFNQSISENSKPGQFKILPTVSGLLLATTLVMFIPIKNPKK